jgi:hypothetical protein
MFIITSDPAVIFIFLLLSAIFLNNNASTQNFIALTGIIAVLLGILILVLNKLGGALTLMSIPIIYSGILCLIKLEKVSSEKHTLYMTLIILAWTFGFCSFEINKYYMGNIVFTTILTVAFLQYLARLIDKNAIEN